MFTRILLKVSKKLEPIFIYLQMFCVYMFVCLMMGFAWVYYRC